MKIICEHVSNSLKTIYWKSLDDVERIYTIKMQLLWKRIIIKTPRVKKTAFMYYMLACEFYIKKIVFTTEQHFNKVCFNTYVASIKFKLYLMWSFV